ncbi:MAG TPA: serine hydroxymethyltransferase, partial [Tissierellaceae bacterium]|nr:serine hydroxymethyltransferase [Tissierellaceae bacterium]
SPFVTSGIRIGTPAVTTRGMKEEDMVEIAKIMSLALDEKEDRQTVKDRVAKLCDKYPLYK